MKTNLRYTVVSTVLVLALVAGIVQAVAHQQPTQTEVLDFSRLTLEVSTTKDSFLRLEPIPLILTMSNKTGHAVMGHTALDFSSRLIKVFVSRNGGTEQAVNNLSPVSILQSVTTREIKAGESHESKQLLSLDLGNIFPQAGTYKIRATLLDVEGDKEISSRHLNIKIVEPEGINRRAFDYIKSRPNASYFFSGLELADTEQALVNNEQFAFDFEETEYADYMNYRLGTLYFAKEDFHKAKVHFLKLSTKEKFIYKDKAAEYLQKAKNKLGEAEGLN
jgi:hypothetical protein